MNDGYQARPALTARPRNPATDITAAAIGLAVLSPVLAAPIGLAWRVARWAAGLG